MWELRGRRLDAALGRLPGGGGTGTLQDQEKEFQPEEAGVQRHKGGKLPGASRVGSARVDRRLGRWESDAGRRGGGWAWRHSFPANNGTPEGT